MRNHLQKSIIAIILVMTLLMPMAFGVSAQETTPLPTETAVSSETAPPETTPAEAETVPATEAPAETEPTGLVIHGADPASAVYQICDNLAQNMGARHLFVYHSGKDQMLYSRTTGNGKLFPASITKLFSAYVALQYLDPETVITAGDELDLVHEGSSLAYIHKGSRLPVKMIVEGMMLPSGNDAAIVLAAAAGRVIAQDDTLLAADAVQVFVDEMNRQGDALGFEKTHFSNPDGWHTGSHYTCMNDLVRISELVLENETIRRYAQMEKDSTRFLSGEYVVWENTNLLLLREGSYYRGDAVGMKTGYTRPAGYSLMTAFTFEEGEIVIGLFGYTAKYDRFLDAIRLIKAVKEQLRSEQSVG